MLPVKICYHPSVSSDLLGLVIPLVLLLVLNSLAVLLLQFQFLQDLIRHVLVLPCVSSHTLKLNTV